MSQLSLTESYSCLMQWARAVEALESGEPGSDASFGMKQRPDGDLEIDERFFRKENFHIPDCKICNGVLKPDVSLLT
jgi:NAD-dependent deacetylase sirtuin 4